MDIPTLAMARAYADSKVNGLAGYEKKTVPMNPGETVAFPFPLNNMAGLEVTIPDGYYKLKKDVEFPKIPAGTEVILYGALDDGKLVVGVSYGVLSSESPAFVVQCYGEDGQPYLDAICPTFRHNYPLADSVIYTPVAYGDMEPGWYAMGEGAGFVGYFDFDANPLMLPKNIFGPGVELPPEFFDYLPNYKIVLTEGENGNIKPGVSPYVGFNKTPIPSYENDTNGEKVAVYLSVDILFLHWDGQTPDGMVTRGTSEILGKIIVSGEVLNKLSPEFLPDIPTFDLAAMGLGAVVIDSNISQTIELPLDVWGELTSALDSGLVKYNLNLSYQGEVIPVTIIGSAATAPNPFHDGVVEQYISGVIPFGGQPIMYSIYTYPYSDVRSNGTISASADAL